MHFERTPCLVNESYNFQNLKKQNEDIEIDLSVCMWKKIEIKKLDGYHENWS